MPEHLYIHVPFCHRICPYCSFYKHLPGQANQGDFVAALLAETGQYTTDREIRPKTIYLGGGTPSLLKAEHLAELFRGFSDLLDLSALEEASLEANPRTFDREKADVLAQIGIDRVSLGVQSWDPDVLQTLGRDHSPTEAEEAFEILRRAGIPSLNIDLMFSIPGQATETWMETLEKTISLQPDHISAYNLNYEEDTEFFEKLGAGEFVENEDTDADQFTIAMDRLAAKGYEHYEISNYGKEGHRSRHNQAYWAGNDYVGLGPGAVSTIDGVRWTNVKDTAAYTEGWMEGAPPPRAEEPLSEESRLIERIALGLRRSEGVATDLLSAEPLAELVAADLLEIDGENACLSRKGKYLADPVVGHLIDGL